VKQYLNQYPSIKLFENPKKIIPAAMNIGIINAKYEIIMKIDSHTKYPKDYILKCVNYLIEYNADNVGGVIEVIPRNNTHLGKAVVISISHPFGVGNSLFRIGKKEPTWADTAFSGCYKRDVFERVGLYDENIARSSDILMNSNLRKSGGKILLVPEIVSYYYARSNFWDFIKHNFDNGFWVIYPLKFGKVLFSLRHLAPLAFISILIASLAASFFFPIFAWLFLSTLGLHCLINLYFSSKIALKKNDIRYLLLIPLTFLTLHISYGLGSLFGLLKAFTSKKFWQN
jgi:GT2 family glycosyltransferase